MRLFVLVSTGLSAVSAWCPQSPSLHMLPIVVRSRRVWHLSASPDQPTGGPGNEWDFILTEGYSSASSPQGETLNALQTSSSTNSRRRIAMPSKDGSRRTTVLASSTYATTTSSEALSSESAVDSTSDAGQIEPDPYASAFDAQMEKMQQYAERVEQASQNSSFGDRLKTMGLSDIISTLIIPSVALFAASRWAFNRVSSRVAENTDALIDSFSREMIYHDGDFDEMRLCYSEYSKKLLFLGPSRTDTMLKAYLEEYAKKKTVSPQAIVSLSYVFTMAKLSDERVAELLVSLCRRMGADKISSAGKLLFFGSRIIKSAEGKQALEPIKDMIKGTYRDASVADTLVETSQQYVGLFECPINSTSTF